MGQRWSLRMSQCSYMTDVFDASRAIEGAEVNNSLVVFWCKIPPSESIDGRTLVVPMDGEVYGQDVVVYVLKCSAQALNFELCQMRYNKYMESATLCAGCSNSPYLNERLSACGACKVVEYCTRDCQRVHWKRIHRHMCKHASLLRFCSGMSDDVAFDERADFDYQSRVRMNVRLLALGSENVIYVDNTVDILKGILETAISKAWGPELAENYMLPPRNPSRPHTVEGSVRIFSRVASKFNVEFSIGYLTSTPTILQQEELQYFFQLPPHNPLKLKSEGSPVFLKKCKVCTDDERANGFRLVKEMALDAYSLASVAELLDYLLLNTNLYLAQ